MQMKSSATKIVHTIFLSLFIIGSLQVNLKPFFAENALERLARAENAWEMFARTSSEQYERERKEKRDQETQETIASILLLIFLGGSLYFWYWTEKNNRKPK